MNLQTAEEFLHYGAAFLCVGSALLDKEAIALENWNVLTERAEQFLEIVRKARNSA